MDIAIIGAGRAGTAVAVLWQRAGHRIVAASGRASTAGRVSRHLPGVPLLDAAHAARDAELVVIGVPDDVIGQTVHELAGVGVFAPGRWVAHLSGATPLAALDAARDVGARRLGVHPLQTFPDVGSAIERIPGCTVAIGADDDEGAFVAERLAEDLGGRPFRLADDHRAVYHAAAVFASNYLVAGAAVAEHLLEVAGVPDPLEALAPLQRATVANLARIGPIEALTGPAVRGDAGTVARNLEAVAVAAPEAVDAYVAMARIALDLGMRRGRLSPQGRAAVEEVLARWT
ncbi:MAG: DUF2520 domain-containing protein [Actinomycetota bacterium]|nr:DUF2520 domain-containing protein [Actinomycetota bacterium]MDH5223162.1 DUF2520 domain-containing protein [Actinomycetota bacterium]